MDQESIGQLLRGSAFPHPAAAPELRETHISWVILAGEYAYKIKKPVEFGFLDFSTAALRRHFCEEELRLNRRFAPELYLDVVPITRGDTGLRFGGPGPAVDYAVRMRRFDERELLSNVAARGGLDDKLVRDLARELARLQEGATVCRPDGDREEPGTPRALRGAIGENFRQVRDYALAPAEAGALAGVEDWTLSRYGALLPVMLQRLAQGHVIDGHGDAHLGNIARVDGHLRLFDCIEFNPAFRIMDGIGEIAFMAMDMDARGHHAQAHLLLTDYLEYRGDYAGLAVLDLYRSYFAMVRAKVSLLRESADHPAITGTDAYAQFRRYLALAQHYCRPRRVFLSITHGVSGSGKSTAAGKLVEAGGAVRVRSDVERKRLFGLAPEARSQPADEPVLYGPEMTRRTFRRLSGIAEQVVGAGFGVIVDATFLHRRVRDDFRALAARLRVPFAIIDCSADAAELRRRLTARERTGRDASEAGVAVMERQLLEIEPLAGAELACRMRADSAAGADALWRQFQQALP